MSGLAVRSLAIAVALAAGAALFAETRHYGLIGFDTHPLIASARVESPGDFADLFVERLMDGRYPSAFYRPLASATFALDEALWGLDPFGYQLTGALLFTVLLLGLGALGEKIGGARSRWMAIALPTVFALHPSYYEIVPIPARRADLLCCVFAISAVVLTLSRRALAAGVVSLLAILSKESGYAVPLLVAAAAAGLGDERGIAARARAAFDAASPALALAALALAVRLTLLDGLGGHREGLSVLGTLALAPGVASELARGVVLFGAAKTPLAQLGLLAGLALAAGGLLLARRSSPLDGASELSAIGFGFCWGAVFALPYAGAGWVGAWYYMLPAVGGAISFTALIGWLVRVSCARAHAVATRSTCAAAALLLGAVGLWQASFAPWFHSYGEWQRATEVADEFLEELDRRIVASVPGQRVDAPPLPMWAHPREGIPGVSGAAILSDYSVQAWADLVHPERSVRVLGVAEGVLPEGPEQPSPGEVVVRLSRRRVGY
ncbi:MAG: hypothetical protein VX681_00605 [Myxococcota bacterium]|nr:hypothetical protein [Myxococcota bacterium]